MGNKTDNRLSRPSGKKRRVNVIKYAKEIRAELKKVVWPTRAQLINNTVTVLITCALIGFIIFLADSAFLGISRALFG